VLLGAVAVCVKATERGGRRRTCVPCSDVGAEEGVCVAEMVWWGLLITWVAWSDVGTGAGTINTLVDWSWVSTGEVCVARSPQATSASNAGGGDPGSLSKLGSWPSAPLSPCNISSQVSLSIRLRREPDPWLMGPAPRPNWAWASSQDSAHSSFVDASSGWVCSRRS